MSLDTTPNRPTIKERHQEKLQAKSRGLTVEEWRERKTKNQEKFRGEQKEKLETSPLKLSFRNDLALKSNVDIAAWEGSYPSLLSFLKAAYEKDGESDPEQVSLKARAVQRFVIDMVGDDSLAMTSAAMLRFHGNTLELVGVHSNKYGKRVEEIVQDRKLDAEMNAAQKSLPEAARSVSYGPTVTLTGDQKGLHFGGTLPRYNPADDGIVQDADGTWVSDGTKPDISGPSTIKPAQL